MGIEPTRPAWKAGILPLNYTRNCAVTENIIAKRRRVVKPFGKHFLFSQIGRGCMDSPAAPLFRLCLDQSERTQSVEEEEIVKDQADDRKHLARKAVFVGVQVRLRSGFINFQQLFAL